VRALFFGSPAIQAATDASPPRGDLISLFRTESTGPKPAPVQIEREAPAAVKAAAPSPPAIVAQPVVRKISGSDLQWQEF
jgi:hypothetical protein